MYINEQLDKIIDILYEIKGYNIANNDITSYNNKKTSNINKASFSFTKNEFLELRFKNKDHELKEYLKRKNTFKSKGEDLRINKIIESDDNMKGCVIYRKKENRYMGSFYYCKKRYYVYAKSKSSCWNKIRLKRKELKENFEIESHNISKNMSLNTWFEYWIENFKKGTVKDSTYLKQIELYNRYIRNKLGTKKINLINTLEIQEFLNKIISYDAKKRVLKILKDLFILLHQENYIKRNPTISIMIAKEKIINTPSSFKTSNKILNYQDELKLLEYLKQNKAKCYHATVFALYTGLRRGEIIGLTWNNVDLNENTITICQQWNIITNKITSLKTKTSYRIIPLLEPAKNILLELIKNVKIPIQENNNDFVFKNIERFSQMLFYYSKKTNINVNPHMLRHTFSSRCYASGLDPIKIKQLLGHKSVDITLDTYTHILDDEIIIEKMKKYFYDLNLL